MDNGTESLRKDTQKDVECAAAEVFTPLRMCHIKVSRMNVRSNGEKNS